MSRTAILISGEYRKLDITRKTMGFLDRSDVDIYVCTWDKTIYNNNKIGLRIVKPITKELVLSDLQKPASIRIDPFRNVSGKYNIPMIDRWLTGFQMIKNSHKTYDHVICTRTDLFYQNKNLNIDFIQRYKTEFGVAWATSLHLKKLPDVFFTGSYEIISKLFNELSIQKWILSEENDWHIWWHDFVTGIAPVQDILDLESFTFCRYWTKPEHTFLDALQIHHDWRDLRLLDEVDRWGEQHAISTWPKQIFDEAKKKWEDGYYNKYKHDQGHNF